MKLKQVKKEPWYKNGLRFECTGCGKCCTGSKGEVQIQKEELDAMAELLQLAPKDFKRLYVKNRSNRLSLVELKQSDGQYACVFLKENRCTVYMARPTQCRTYPFWPENLNTPESWQLAAKDCEGISDSALLVYPDCI
ncbi:MAG: YkgJ family cysteine cluster protein [Parachlamydiaceae bacterium]